MYGHIYYSIKLGIKPTLKTVVVKLSYLKKINKSFYITTENFCLIELC